MNLTIRIIASLVFSIELIFIVEFLLKARNNHPKTIILLFGVALCLLFISCFAQKAPYFPLTISICLPLILFFILVLLFKKVRTNCKHLHYSCNDTGKIALYSGHKVMFIVPHPDDDMNIASGVLEQYVKHGSEVSVVFVTNGDYWNIAEIRLREAIQALQSIGIPEDHVIFLGYADGWSTDAPHIYNAAAGTVCKSRNGYTATYALNSHPAWNDNNAYTSDNLIKDIEAVIVNHHPDVIFCSDYDSNIEHKATTLAFEKAMGHILKQEHTYHPVVLKSFAYCTAWTAPKDFPALNLCSTADPGDQLFGIYHWADRIRLPVDGTKLSRSLLMSELYLPISLYKSQRAGIAAGAIINGDKVFWQRRTDSLLLPAQIDVSSGDAKKLNNFMLLDSRNLFDDNHLPYDGVWIPDKEDHAKSIVVTFPAPCDIAELILYDSPSPHDNVLNAHIAFDTGYGFDTGPLKGHSNAASFVVNQEGVQSFTIKLLETEGEHAGLCEIEAFAQPYSSPFSFIKLMDPIGHFAYDYVIDESGTDTFRLYTFGDMPALSPQNYSITCDHPSCSASISEERVIVQCPPGYACNVVITCLENERISDSIYIRNLSTKERKRIVRTQRLEDFFHRRATYIWKQTLLCRYSSNANKVIHGVLRKCKYFLLSLRSSHSTR